MITVTYDYYKSSYDGVLNEESFNKYLKRAIVKLDSLTFCRVSKLNDSADEYLVNCVKDCLCALVDKINSNTNEDGVEIDSVKSSETVGPWTVSYNTNSKNTISVERQYKNIVNNYLGNTNLLCKWI